MSFIRINGKWATDRPLPNNSPGYWQGLLDALNGMEPLFYAAQKKSDFEFIFALLRFKGTNDAGWDTLETIKNVLKNYTRVREKIRYDADAKAHYSLLFYGLTIEASEPYEVLANLLNIIEGKRVVINNFPDKPNSYGKLVPQPPINKINQLKSRAKRQNFDLDFFNKFYDNKLRNAVFHSDFTIFSDETRINHPQTIYKSDQVLSLINKAQAYIEVFFRLYYEYIRSYKKPEIIKVPTTFSHVPGEDAITIIREKHGVIGLKSNLTDQQVAKGSIPWNVIRYLPYEKKLIDNGTLLLPINRIDQINALIRPLPGWIKVKLVKIFKRSSWLSN